jgi:hypothetical protein
MPTGRRFGKEKDANHNELVGAWQSVGLSVYEANNVGGGFPDAIVGGSMPCPLCGKKFKQNKLVEIKVPGRRGNLNPLQVKFHAAWKGQITVARTIEEALKIAGTNNGGLFDE